MSTSAAGQTHVLLDLDGTISDSSPGIGRSLQHAFGVCGYEPPTDEQVRGVIGPPFEVSFPTLGVPIDDILRYEMYAENYGREKRAMLQYSRIPPERRADRCLSCDAPCSGACEFGIPIRERLGRADRSLRWG